MSLTLNGRSVKCVSVSKYLCVSDAPISLLCNFSRPKGDKSGSIGVSLDSQGQRKGLTTSEVLKLSLEMSLSLTKALLSLCVSVLKYS